MNLSLITSNIHTHTQFCDAKNTAEEMVCSAISCGLKTLGFSGHSFTPFDPDYCMNTSDYQLYQSEILRLKEKYAEDIKILCGIELDCFSENPKIKFDYTIGSVHYVQKNGEYIPVDLSADILQDAADKHYKGDIYSLIEDYYLLLGNLCADKSRKIDIVGHFDLLTKFDESTRLFDTSAERYKNAWKSAADKLLAQNLIFEINTGAIARGLRTTPYPAPDIIEYLALHGATFTITSDCHYKDKMISGFDIAETLIKQYDLKIINF